MNRQIYSVSSLNRYVKQVLDNDINVCSILVKGEVSNFTNHRSGHWYFTLKDRFAKIPCVMFASYASKTKIILKEGMQVILHASLSMYEAQGSCQLFVTSVQIDGLGDLYIELEQSKERLRKEGYFSEDHKQKIPNYPMDIGVITAKTGAAVQDILTTIARRWPLAKVNVFPTLVQGINAVPAILKSLELAEQKHFDVIVLARGGGAIEDLWCFNDETLARYIFDMKTPIVTGVGHESDTTLVDYVSDARAPTPTAAAELITPDIQEVKSRILQYQNVLIDDIQYLLELKSKQLDAIQEHRYLRDPFLYVQQKRMALAMHVKSLEQTIDRTKRKQIQFDNLSQRLHLAAAKHVERYHLHISNAEQALSQNLMKYQMNRQQQLKEKIMLLDAFSPLKILSRGYSITYKEEKIVHVLADVQKEDHLHIRLQDGTMEVKVQDLKGTTL